MYASYAIHHIHSGKAYVRALGGHVIIHVALIQIMIGSLIDSGKIASMQLETFSNLQPSKETDDAIIKVLVTTINKKIIETLDLIY